ncbi:MAG: nitrilase-related carbon-nitrogen hydrolase [Kosmotogaceae bacterium]
MCKTMKIALVEFELVNNKPEENTQKMIEIIDETVEDTDIIIFPEMAFTGFTMNRELYKVQDIESILEKSKIVQKAILFGWIEKEGNNFYNSSIFYDPFTEKTIKYRKQRLFSYRDENKHYSPGKSSIEYEFKSHRLSHLICYDLRFPELFRQVKGVELFIVIACWPMSREDHWKTLLKARAIENQAFIVGLNRSGTGEIGEEYGNISVAFDYFGKEIRLDNSCIIKYVDITEEDFQCMKKWRKKFPVLNDM